jgi:1,4-dihydroxy-2-naphthoyl-CoA synthase
VRGHAGYIGGDGVPRLNVLDLQKRSAASPSPSSPWSRVTPSAVVMCCMWYVI